jgi:hypothetical protein
VNIFSQWVLRIRLFQQERERMNESRMSAH